jgi:exosortase K
MEKPTRSQRPNFIILIVVSLFLFILKIASINSGVDFHLWLLFPVKILTGIFTGMTFLFEPGTGFVSIDGMIIINGKCSGLNFFIITVFLSVFTGMKTGTTLKKKIFITVVFIVSSYMLTVFSNSVRITVSIFLSHFRNSFVLLSEAGSWVHEITGTFVFLFFLLSYYFIFLKGDLWKKFLKFRISKT